MLIDLYSNFCSDWKFQDSSLAFKVSIVIPIFPDLHGKFYPSWNTCPRQRPFSQVFWTVLDSTWTVKFCFQINMSGFLKVSKQSVSVCIESITLYQNYSSMNPKLTGLGVQLCIFYNPSSASYTPYACLQRLT